MIANIYLIIGALNSLPIAIISGVQAITSSKRIDHLLQSEQAKSIHTYHLEKGAVLVKQLVCRWDSEQSNLHWMSTKKHFTQKFSLSLTSRKARSDVLDAPLSERAFSRESTSREVTLRVPFDINLQRGDRLIILGNVGVAGYSIP
jgi:hypothetical protein